MCVCCWGGGGEGGGGSFLCAKGLMLGVPEAKADNCCPMKGWSRSQ